MTYFHSLGCTGATHYPCTGINVMIWGFLINEPLSDIFHLIRQNNLSTHLFLLFLWYIQSLKNILEKHLELIPGLTDGRWEKVQSSNLIFSLLNSSFEMKWITNCIVRGLHKEYNTERIRRAGSEALPISWRYYGDGLVRQPQTPNGPFCIKKGLAHHAKWDAAHLYDTKAAW